MLNNKRILIIRLSSIGDVLHATPVPKALKKAYPSCHITWLVSKISAPLLESNPYIDAAHIWSREALEAAAANRQWRRIKQHWQELTVFYRHNKFDLVIDVHGLFLTGLIAWRSGCPRRIGMAHTHEGNSFFMTEIAPAPIGCHVIERYLSTLKPLGVATRDYAMTLPVTAASRAAVSKLLAPYNIIKPLVLLSHQTTWTSKLWGDDNFAALLDKLPATVQPVLIGSPADREHSRAILHQTHRNTVIDLTGRTSLPELAALVDRADLLITSDTGALHMAIALDTPSISLWGPSPPERYGPLQGGRHSILRPTGSCHSCHKTKCPRPNDHCMRTISPDMVIACLPDALTTHR